MNGGRELRGILFSVRSARVLIGTGRSGMKLELIQNQNMTTLGFCVRAQNREEHDLLESLSKTPASFNETSWEQEAGWGNFRVMLEIPPWMWSTVGSSPRYHAQGAAEPSQTAGNGSPATTTDVPLSESRKKK